MTIQTATETISGAEPELALPSGDLRDGIAELYLDYVELLDGERYADWLELFAETSSYLAISKENYDAGLPIATIRCDSRGMLADRLHAIQHTAMFEPRTMRHIIGPARVRATGSGALKAEASFVVLRSMHEGFTEVFCAAATSTRWWRSTADCGSARRWRCTTRRSSPTRWCIPCDAYPRGLHRGDRNRRGEGRRSRG